MADIAFDTDALADFLAQFYGSANRGKVDFVGSDWLSADAAELVNRILRDYRVDGSVNSYAVASSFAFLEILRKWNALVKGRIQPHQMRAFLESPPEWFLISPVDETIVPYYCRLPAAVVMADKSIKSIEWTDAVHVATALSRHDPPHSRCFFCTQDTRIVQIELVAAQCL